MRLQGQVAVITGGSSGIGEATARLFAQEGATVAIAFGRDVAKAEAVVSAITDAGGKAIAIKMDVRSPSAIDGAMAQIKARLGPIDILVNAAGVYMRTPLGKTTEAVFDQLMNTNLKGTFFAIQAVASDMKARRRGRIINVASAAAFRGSALYPLYSASKAAVVMLTKGFALDLAPFDVAINGIAPGNTETPINASDRADEAIMAAKRRATPSTRVYSPPTEMAEAILFLADGRVKAMHGATIVLDEGTGA